MRIARPMVARHTGFEPGSTPTNLSSPNEYSRVPPQYVRSTPLSTPAAPDEPERSPRRCSRSEWRTHARGYSQRVPWGHSSGTLLRARHRAVRTHLRATCWCLDVDVNCCHVIVLPTCHSAPPGPCREYSRVLPSATLCYQSAVGLGWCALPGTAPGRPHRPCGTAGVLEGYSTGPPTQAVRYCRGTVMVQHRAAHPPGRARG